MRTTHRKIPYWDHGSSKLFLSTQKFAPTPPPSKNISMNPQAFKWEMIGQVVAGPSGGAGAGGTGGSAGLLNGQQWDHVFDVAMEGELPWNHCK